MVFEYLGSLRVYTSNPCNVANDTLLNLICSYKDFLCLCLFRHFTQREILIAAKTTKQIK